MSLLTASSLYCSERKLTSEIDCFHSKSKTLAFLENKWPKSGLAILVVMVGELANSFNLGKNMSAAQVTDTALMILNDYPELKIDDVALCFTKAKKGTYGKVYDRLDGAVVFEWLNRFLADKDEQIQYYWQHQQMTIKSADEQKLLAAPAVDNEMAVKHIKAIRNDIVKMQIRNNTAKKTFEPIRRTNDIQDLHQIFIKQFNAIYDAQNEFGARGAKFITKYGIMLDIAEYIQIKHGQFMAYAEKIRLRWEL